MLGPEEDAQESFEALCQPLPTALPNMDLPPFKKSDMPISATLRKFRRRCMWSRITLPRPFVPLRSKKKKAVDAPVVAVSCKTQRPTTTSIPSCLLSLISNCSHLYYFQSNVSAHTLPHLSQIALVCLAVDLSQIAFVFSQSIHLLRMLCVRATHSATSLTHRFCLSRSRYSYSESCV
jgi:hypothetical protein